MRIARRTVAAHPSPDDHPLSGGRSMRSSRALLAAALTALCLSASAALAQDAKLDVRQADTVRTVLERHVGKRVSVVLTTGPELAGVVQSVNDKVVHLSELTGREFFDAVVNIEQIGAVVMRVRSR